MAPRTPAVLAATLLMLTGSVFGQTIDTRALQQDAVEGCNYFLEDCGSPEMKGGLDNPFLDETLKQGYHYRRRALTQIRAQAESRLLLTKTSVSWRGTLFQEWDSYVLYKDDQRILEYRRYGASQMLTEESAGTFEVDAGEKIRELTQYELARENVDREIRGSDYAASVRVDLLNGTSYLIIYEFKDAVPSRAIHLTLERNRLVPWAAQTEQQEAEERVRKDLILRTAYLVDDAVLPNGNAALPGDQWKIPAQVMATVIKLQATEIRDDGLKGSLLFELGEHDRLFRPDDAFQVERDHAAIELIGRPADNRIYVATKERVRTRRNLGLSTSESYSLWFLPDIGYALWDRRYHQASLIRLQGAVDAERRLETAWIPKVEKGRPEFESCYESLILSSNFYTRADNREALAGLGDLLRQRGLTTEAVAFEHAFAQSGGQVDEKTTPINVSCR